MDSVHPSTSLHNYFDREGQYSFDENSRYHAGPYLRLYQIGRRSPQRRRKVGEYMAEDAIELLAEDLPLVENREWEMDPWFNS